MYYFDFKFRSCSPSGKDTRLEHAHITDEELEVSNNSLRKSVIVPCCITPEDLIRTFSASRAFIRFFFVILLHKLFLFSVFTHCQDL